MIDLKRNCPNCEEKIIYSRIYDLKNANLKNSLCRICANIKTSSIKVLTNKKKEKINNIRVKFKYKVDNNFFKKIDSSDKAYWLGYICADGNISKNTFNFSIASKDREIIEKFKSAINSNHKIYFREYYDKRYLKTYKIYNLIITRKEIVLDLINLGITSNKTNELEMPKIEEKYYSYFFAGLFDGDGCVFSQKKKNKIYYGVDLISTKEILEFLQQYLICKYNFSKTSIKKIKSKKENLYHINFYKNAKDFMNWIYQDEQFSYLQRKMDKYRYLK